VPVALADGVADWPPPGDAGGFGGFGDFGGFGGFGATWWCPEPPDEWRFGGGACRAGAGG